MRAMHDNGLWPVGALDLQFFLHPVTRVFHPIRHQFPQRLQRGAVMQVSQSTASEQILLKDVGRRSVDFSQMIFAIKGEDAAGNLSEHGLQIQASLLRLLLRRSRLLLGSRQLSGHIVERMYQDTQLVVTRHRLQGNKLATCHRLGSCRQTRDGRRQSSRQMQTHPHRRQYRQQQGYRQAELKGRFHRFAHQHQLVIPGIRHLHRLCGSGQLLGDGLLHIKHAVAFPQVWAQHRDQHLYQQAALGFRLDGGSRMALFHGENFPARQTRGQTEVITAGGDDPVIAGEEGYAAQAILIAQGNHGDYGAAVRLPHQRLGNAFRRQQRGIAVAVNARLGHIQGLIQRTLHRAAEPRVHAPIQILPGKTENDGCRQKTEQSDDDHQAGSQLTAHLAAPQSQQQRHHRDQYQGEQKEDDPRRNHQHGHKIMAQRPPGAGEKVDPQKGHNGEQEQNGVPARSHP